MGPSVRCAAAKRRATSALEKVAVSRIGHMRYPLARLARRASILGLRAHNLAKVADRLLPRTVHLCVHCRYNTAGFWVSRLGDQTPRRPWCLTCCQQLDREHHDVIPFDRWERRGSGS